MKIDASDNLNPIDIVFIDRDQGLLDCFKFYYGETRNIETYQDPRHFLDALPRYAKGTKMVFGYLFSQSGINGLELAVLLHDQGFTRLYLHTGMIFPASQHFPDYLTVVVKRDGTELDALLNKRDE